MLTYEAPINGTKFLVDKPDAVEPVVLIVHHDHKRMLPVAIEELRYFLEEYDAKQAKR